MYPDSSPSGSTHGGRLRDTDPPPPDPGAALKDAASRFGELKEYASYLVAAKLDGLKVTARNIAIFAALGVVGLAAGCVVIIMAVVLLLSGIAQGLASLSAHLFGAGWAWLGPFLVGSVILGGLAAGIVIGLKKLTKTTHSKLVSTYENRKRQQRSDFGRDVEQRAREQHVA